MRERLRTAQDAFHPDGWFFDFYASPYKKGTQRFPEALEAGIKWIHDEKKVLGKPKPRQFVGGTVWGTKVPVPPSSDFIAITDRGGSKYTRDLAEHFGKKVPILMHIDNDPNNPKGKGGQFYNGTRDRKDVLKDHVRDQKDGYTYMFPIFYPLKTPPPRAFDMRQYPDLFKTMCELARDNCGAPPA